MQMHEFELCSEGLMPVNPAANRYLIIRDKELIAVGHDAATLLPCVPLFIETTMFYPC